MLDVGDELYDGTSHKVTLIDSICVPNKRGGLAMKSPNRQPFSAESAESNAAQDIEIMRELDQRPPRSAKLVACIDFGSGPGGGDYRTYLLSTDRGRSGWSLWLMVSDYDTGKQIYCEAASGSPCRGYSAKYAAEQLLTKVLEDERDIGWADPPPWGVMEAGLLDADDIERIGTTVFAEDAL